MRKGRGRPQSEGRRVTEKERLIVYGPERGPLMMQWFLVVVGLNLHYAEKENSHCKKRFLTLAVFLFHLCVHVTVLVSVALCCLLQVFRPR